MKEKVDLRIVKTKKALRNALMELIKEEEFEKITIYQICDRALINRMTFYKHYQNKYDLLNDIFLELKEEIVTYIKVNNDSPNLLDEPMKFYKLLLDALYSLLMNNLEFFKSVYNQETILSIISSLIENNINNIINHLTSIYNFKYDIDLMVISATGALTYLFKYWIKNKTLDDVKQFKEVSTKFLNDAFESRLFVEKK